MSDTVQPAESLSKEGGTVKDVKFFFRNGCTKKDLEAFREKAWAQVNSGASQEDTDQDW